LTDRQTDRQREKGKGTRKFGRWKKREVGETERERVEIERERRRRSREGWLIKKEESERDIFKITLGFNSWHMKEKQIRIVCVSVCLGACVRKRDRGKVCS
jgi:hypothetical protein